MGLDVGRIEPNSFTTSPVRPERGPRAASAQDTFTVSHGDVPESPPAEVLDAMSTAGRVARELHEQGRELRFVPSEEQRVRIEVRDLDGNVLREIPPSELLDVATGAPLD